MKFIADLHIHSHYSRATSKKLDFFHLTKWAQIKGIQLLITGDIAHPGWLAEIQENLVPAEGHDGLFRPHDELVQRVAAEVPPACQQPVYYMLGGEISGIYKRDDRVRKVHNMIYTPTLESAEKIQAALEKIGNIRSDGRPILGLPCRDLLEIILDIDDQNALIPAHIWTPWFSLLGSKSGYDTVEECFGDLSEHIFAVESGLSSDPPMNELVSMLDKYTLVSHSDAHSPQKLGREADIFTTEITYPAVFDALKRGDRDRFWGTLEFFPEEGKYHFDGHRKCQVCWHPRETIAHDGLCSGCGKKVTVGVMHRVQELADRDERTREAMATELRRRYQSLTPLPELLSEIHGVGPNSKRVQRAYFELLTSLGSELAILLDLPLECIAQDGSQLLSEGIRRMRAGQVHVQSGYDGEYGRIKVFAKDELEKKDGQLTLFERPSKLEDNAKANSHSLKEREPEHFTSQRAKTENKLPIDVGSTSRTSTKCNAGTMLRRAYTDAKEGEPKHLSGLNAEQMSAVLYGAGHLLIMAGPGTGKTRTLTARIAHLVIDEIVVPKSILAITFTNKAAQEMIERLREMLGDAVASEVTTCTFHALGAMLLREHGNALGLSHEFIICSDSDRLALLRSVAPELSSREASRVLEFISAAKNDPALANPANGQETDSQSILAQANLKASSVSAECSLYDQYNHALRTNQMVDFDDLILLTVRLFEEHPHLLETLHERFRWISVDEYQDVNPIQYRLLQLLTGRQTNLCVIGDPDQAIYGFRGADRRYFLRFSQDFQGAHEVTLQQNYRSTQTILDAAQQVIEREDGRAVDGEAIRIWSEFVEQTKLDLYQASTDKAEAEYIVHQIEQMVGGTSYFSLDSGRVDDEGEMTRAFGDFAVLVRLSAQMSPLIEAFERSGIPYQAVGQTPLTEEKPIQEILAYMWLLANPDNEFLHNKIERRLQAPLLIAPFIRDLGQRIGVDPVSEIIWVIDAFILEQHPHRARDSRQEMVQRFARLALGFETRLIAFLEAMALQRESDVYDARADRVAIMTIHASKGLEFPVVFIAGCEETIIPYQLGRHMADVNEERRLFYVGMTRAREKIVLSHAKSRVLFGQYMQNSASRFVSDIEDSLKELKRLASPLSTKRKQENLQLSLFDV